MAKGARGLWVGVMVLVCAGTVAAQDAHPNVAAADREYAAVFSHAEEPCPGESTTMGYAECIGKEVEFTEGHLRAFLSAIRGIAAEEDTAPPLPGVPRKREVVLLNDADRAWRIYKKNLCELQFAGMAGGSGAASAQEECIYRADRQYTQQIADAVELKILAP